MKNWTFEDQLIGTMEDLFDRSEWFDVWQLPDRNAGELTLDEQFTRAVKLYMGSIDKKDREKAEKRLREWWEKAEKGGWVPPGDTKKCLMTLLNQVEVKCISKAKCLKAEKPSKFTSGGRKN